MNEARERRLWWMGWLTLGLPALYQLALMMSAIVRRLAYPYDLEWMEGGILNHAARIADGSGIYVEPSLDFIPFLYTPLYPGLLGLLEPITGINYPTGRAISVLALVGIIALVFLSLVPRVAKVDRPAAVAGGFIAVGFFSAVYPWVQGWYDLVRADTLALALSISGVVAANAWANSGTGWRGHLRVGGAAAILALGFFTKQTGIFFVAAGGAVVLVRNWRRVPVFVASAGFVGLGGTWLLNKTTGGWFWTYAFEVHQTHECNADRFWDAFGQILWRFPLMTLTVVAGLIALATFAGMRRRLPRSAEPFLLWAWLFVVGVGLGAVGIATQWSEKNAYIPAMLGGAVAAGATIPLLVGVLSELVPVTDARDWRRFIARGAGMAVTFVLSINLVAFESWSPSKFVPTDRDRAAGDALVEEIRKVDGEVFVPFHPWYARLAGKRVYTHRMGVLDMRFQPPLKMAAPQCFFHDARGKKNWKVIGIPEGFRNRHFAAVFWDNRNKAHLDVFTQHYRLDYRFTDKDVTENLRPRVFSHRTQMLPNEVWVPAKKPPTPAGARVLFDFEAGNYKGWMVTGTAWGDRPERQHLARHKQRRVRGFAGRYFATSMHGGDQATGVMTSDEFTITGKRITFKLGGGIEDESLRDVSRTLTEPLESKPWLRIELHVDGTIARYASKAGEPGEPMDDRQWLVPEYVGSKARIVIIDNATTKSAHLNVDELWVWAE